ncbi:MAG: GIY-YIG nuclease family protein [Candidatus Beckwithbacteria bacterium]|nr:GIY-YIG nuclease family protein [Patescibacteria group bacterium]
MYFVYVLLSLKDKKFYVGMTKNIKMRLLTHKKGEVVSTRYRRPLELLGYEAYWYKVEAGARERYLKSFSARKEFKIRFKESLARYSPGKDLKN